MSDEETGRRSGGGPTGLLALLLSLVVPGIALLALGESAGHVGQALVWITYTTTMLPIAAALAGFALAAALLLSINALWRGSRIFGGLALLIVGATIAIGIWLLLGASQAQLDWVLF